MSRVRVTVDLEVEGNPSLGLGETAVVGTTFYRIIRDSMNDPRTMSRYYVVGLVDIQDPDQPDREVEWHGYL